MQRLFVVFLLVSMISCSKEEDTSANPTWTVEGKTFTAQVFLAGTNDTRWYDVTDPTTATTVNFITVEFSRPMPQVAGTYDIGGTGTDATYIKAINVVNNASTANVTAYLFDTPSKVGTASITVNNGRRFLSFSNVTVKKLNSSGQIVGSSTLSVNFLEY